MRSATTFFSKYEPSRPCVSSVAAPTTDDNAPPPRTSVARSGRQVQGLEQATSDEKATHASTNVAKGPCIGRSFSVGGSSIAEGAVAVVVTVVATFVVAVVVT